MTGLQDNVKEDVNQGGQGLRVLMASIIIFFTCVMHIYSSNYTLITLMNARYDQKKLLLAVYEVLGKMITI